MIKTKILLRRVRCGEKSQRQLMAFSLTTLFFSSLPTPEPVTDYTHTHIIWSLYLRVGTTGLGEVCEIAGYRQDTAKKRAMGDAAG